MQQPSSSADSISTPMMQAINLVLQEIRVCYQPPSGAKSPEDMAIWVKAFTRAVADETADPDEVTAAWREFRLDHSRGFWPTPGAFCEAIRSMRRKRREFTPEDTTMKRLTEPDCHRPELVSWKTRLATMEAIDLARQLPAPFGPALVRLGEAIIERNGPTR